MHKLHVLALVLLSGSACSGTANTTRTFSFEAGSFHHVGLRLDAATLTWLPSDAETAHVDASLHWQGDVAADLSARVVGDTLLVFGTCPQRPKDCSADLQLTTPRDVDIDIVLDRGQATLTDLTGNLDLALQDADLVLANLPGTVHARTDRGSLQLDRLSGATNISTRTGDIVATDLMVPRVEARSERGSIAIDFATAPDLADVSTSSGDIELTLPSGEYDLDTVSTRGSVQTEGVTNTSNAASVILAHSTSGDITVMLRE